jgi:hypothetical protein
MRFFGQSDVHGEFFSDCLHRYRFENNLIYEETWNSNANFWERTDLLTGMIIHGECTLEEISVLKAKSICPRAFLNQSI